MTGLKNRIKNNLPWKIFSVVAAVLLWGIIQMIQNPQIDFTFSNMNVEVVNETVLEERNFAVLPKLDEKVKVKVKCQRWELNKLSDDDFKVYVDLSGIYSSGVVELPVKVRINNELINVSSVSPSTVFVNIDRIVTEEKPVEIHITGSPKENCYTNESMLSYQPEVVSVKGPKTLVDTVTSCIVNVDISSKTDTFTENAKVILVDKDGAAVNNSALTALSETVSVECEIFTKKVVPVELKNVPENVKYTLSSSSVELAGPKSEIEKTEKIIVDNFSFDKLEKGISKDVEFKLSGELVNLNNTKITATISEILSEDDSKKESEEE